MQLANLRRTAPEETARRFEERYRQDTEAYHARLRKDEEAKLEAARGTTVDVGDVQRLDEMQSTMQRGTDDLMALKYGMGGTVAKMEKAQKAVDVVEGR